MTGSLREARRRVIGLLWQCHSCGQMNNVQESRCMSCGQGK